MDRNAAGCQELDFILGLENVRPLLQGNPAFKIDLYLAYQIDNFMRVQPQKLLSLNNEMGFASLRQAVAWRTKVGGLILGPDILERLDALRASRDIELFYKTAQELKLGLWEHVLRLSLQVWWKRAHSHDPKNAVVHGLCYITQRFFIDNFTRLGYEHDWFSDTYFGGEEYPFGGRRRYQDDYHNRSMHTNPMRLAWVEKYLVEAVTPYSKPPESKLFKPKWRK